MMQMQEPRFSLQQNRNNTFHGNTTAFSSREIRENPVPEKEKGCGCCIPCVASL